jgi:hypothetical protein
VFPALPSVVARSARQRKFFLKNKNIFADAEQATTLGKGFFSKMEIIFADGRTQALGTYFLRKIKNPPLCRRPGHEAVGKEDFENRQLPALTAIFLADGPQRLCREPRARVLGKESWLREKFPVGPLLSASLGKGFAKGLVAFAESFRLSANPGFPVVTPVLFRSSLSLIFSLSSIFFKKPQVRSARTKHI